MICLVRNLYTVSSVSLCLIKRCVSPFDLLVYIDSGTDSMAGADADRKVHNAGIR